VRDAPYSTSGQRSAHFYFFVGKPGQIRNFLPYAWQCGRMLPLSNAQSFSGPSVTLQKSLRAEFFMPRSEPTSP
jgi:hypothetical protein